MRTRAVIGIGHPDRGDDAVGRIVSARLAARVPAGVTVLEHDGETAGLLEWLGSAEAVILVDAAMSGAAVGTIQRFDVGASPLPSGCFLSTHGMGLAEAVELARVLGQLPRRCIVYAIEARAFDHGAPLSPEVAAAVDEAVVRVLDELATTAASGPVILRGPESFDFGGFRPESNQGLTTSENDKCRIDSQTLRCEARSTASPSDPKWTARRTSKDAGPGNGRRPRIKSGAGFSRRGARAPRASG